MNNDYNHHKLININFKLINNMYHIYEPIFY